MPVEGATFPLLIHHFLFGLVFEEPGDQVRHCSSAYPRTGL